MSSKNGYQVIIVGAGIAGLAAANYLYQNGITDILILEAKQKAGGRTDTNFFDMSLQDSPLGKIELGAQWIHGEENDFCRIVKSSEHRHHKTSWEGKGDFLLPTGKKANEIIVQEVLDWVQSSLEYVEDNLCIEDFQKRDKNGEKFSSSSSMGEFLIDKFLEYLQEMGKSESSEEYNLRMSIFQWAMSFQRIDNSCDQMTDLSIFRWGEFEVNPGEHYNNFKEGITSFVDNILVRPLSPKCIMFNSPVSKIIWNKKQCAEISTRNGKMYTADCVLVTCSIGVLKEIHSTLFYPALPSKLSKSIEATGFGPIAKIFLKWEKPWWPETLEGFQFLWPNEFINCCDDEENPQDIPEEILAGRWHKSITGFDPVLDNSNVLLGWLGGPEAVFVEKLSEKDVAEKCAKVLRDFTGLPVSVPDAVAVSKWNTDEFFRGAYCYRSTKGDLIAGDIASVLCEPVLQFDSNGNQRPIIFFAGEAMSKTHYSTLHGAYESGQSQAAKIVNCLQKSTFSTTSTADMPKPQDKDSTISCSQDSTSIQLGMLTIDEMCPLPTLPLIL